MTTTPLWRVMVMLITCVLGWSAIMSVPMVWLVWTFIVPIGGLTSTVVSGVTGILFGCVAIILGNITFYRWLEKQP